MAVFFYGHKPQPQANGWNLAPGNRADFLVKFAEPGTYKLVKDRPSYQVNAATPQVLAYVVVEASDDDDPMPTLAQNPPDYLKPLTSIDKVKQEPVAFQSAPEEAQTPAALASRSIMLATTWIVSTMKSSSILVRNGPYKINPLEVVVSLIPSTSAHA
jgi:hypothetical protein